MTIPLVVTTFAAVGVPVSVPLTVLNPAHEGLLVIPKEGILPFPPVTVGLKVYVLPAVTLVAGVPEIFSAVVGAVLPPEPTTFTANGAVLDHCEPLVTSMTIPLVVPTFAAVGLPVRVPLTVLKPAHE